jgi:transposase-like protein
VPVIVVDDLARNAAVRRRRSGLDAPDLPRIDAGSMKLGPRSSPSQLTKPSLSPAAAERFDFSRPLRNNSPIARRFAEDKTLTRFLKMHIDIALSPSIAPPACPHCGSADSRLTGKMRAALALPQFQCRACTRLFTRTTRTPMANMLRKDMLYAILPLLSQHRTLHDAAASLGTKPEIIKSWVRRFREWLMALDPSGDFERRVRLGLKAPAPQIWCPHCRKMVAARPHGFKRTRTKTAAQIRRRLFRCTVCHGFFDVAVDSL